MTELPEQITQWITAKGWRLHPHQITMLEQAQLAANLLIAPTGAGKTLSGFLPTLAELADGTFQGLHTIYVSPLKALAADIKRNLTTPVSEMNLSIRVEDRTGDTTNTVKKRQRADPPQILLTTPESLALLTSYEDAPRLFSSVKRIIIDEIHALAESKRGDQLFLALSRIQSFAPALRRVGLSATVDDPQEIASLLARHPDPCPIHYADAGPPPDIQMLETKAAPPWSGGGAAHAIPEVLDLIKAHKTTLIFHNTRAQAELFFHNLWLANTESLPIAIHHGSLDRQQREKVEAAMVQGHLRAVVCTGSLDLGIDWGDVDLVVQIGAPKNVKRLVQRIGRANHRYNAPSKAVIVPANRFEIIECQASLDAVKTNRLDGAPRGAPPLDVLCQHILLMACSGPFYDNDLYQQIKTAGPYRTLSRADFDACLEFCTTGGYALRRYDQWHRLMPLGQGQYRLRDPRSAQRIRMNAGTIQDSDTLKVRLKRSRGGKPLGEVEEYFASTLTPGDTFLIAGQVVRFEGMNEMTVEVSRRSDKTPKVATFMGTKFATSTQLSDLILNRFAAHDWTGLPDHSITWLETQERISQLPKPGQLLIETFERKSRHHICVYGFSGRNAQQTLGLLLTKRMEDMGLAPLGFVATDYATLIWGLEQVTDPASLITSDTLTNGFETWLQGNAVMKRSFRSVATIAGLIERNLPGQRKTGRQATFSSDILYDTLTKYDPDHLLLRITRDEAQRGLVDFSRIDHMLKTLAPHIIHRDLPHVSPLAAPLFLEVGVVPIAGMARERLLANEAAELMAEAGLNLSS